MDLSIIVVSWNVKNKLIENLKALFKSKGDFDFEVIVLDNDSHDGSARMVKKEFPKVKLIETGANLGFGKANNLGVREAKGEFILFLNPDMRVFEYTLERMIIWMRENRHVHVAGCKLVGEDGENVPHVRLFPSFWDQLAIVLKVPHILPKVIDRYLRKDFDYENASRVDSIRGAFFMVSTAIEKEIDMKIEFDERYFLWFEEVDFCRTVKEKGGEVWYTPVAKCIDLVGQSFNKVPRSTKQNYCRDSMLKYFRKWHIYPEAMVLRAAWIFSGVIVRVADVFKVKPKTRT